MERLIIVAYRLNDPINDLDKSRSSVGTALAICITAEMYTTSLSRFPSSG
jgi:hypothetical protein